ncbi:unnamed protein product [Auanema sp. JU1783]|nr:unnamed protein product [Auanema sp. JU1783]
MLFGYSIGLLLLINGVSSNDSYEEELAISRLPNQHVLTQFRFKIVSNQSNLGHDFLLFPRIIAELVKAHSVEELYVSLGQGRWLADMWGLPPQPSSPTGIHVHAYIQGNTTKTDAEWVKLTNALNGFFCTSFTNVVPLSTSSPTFTLKPEGVIHPESQLRYVSLAKESLCTENLTPWRTLLPCKQNGLATLFTPIKLYSSLYHSLYFQVKKSCYKGSCSWVLNMGLNMVTDKDLKHGKLDWELMGLTGRKVTGFCRAASSSKILVHVDRPNQVLEPAPKIKVPVGGFAVYELNEVNTSPTFSVAAYYDKEETATLLDSSPAFSFSTIIGGTEQSKGEIVTKFVNNAEEIRVGFSHVLPWYVKLYYHTLDLRCTVYNVEQQVRVYNSNFQPAISRKRPALLELEFSLPVLSVCYLRIEFDKAFLRLREYPPDANHGLYLPGVIVKLHNEEKMKPYTSVSRINISEPIILHGNALLVALPTPDFSMPFNVICFVLTVMTLCFGPLHKFSTQLLIPVNTSLPVAHGFKKALRVFLFALIALAAYIQYNEISLNELRRLLVEMMGDSRLGKIVPQQTKRVGLAIVEQQHDLLNGDKTVYQEFTKNLDLIRRHLSTFDDDFKRTRGRMQDALKLLEKYIRRDFNFGGNARSLKFDAQQQLFFVQHSELIIRGIIARIVIPDKFQDHVDGLDLEFYSMACRKLSVRTNAPPSREVMKLAVNQIDESFRRLRMNNSEENNIDFGNYGYPGPSNEDSKEETQSALDIIRERLIRLNVDESCREVLEAQSAHLLDLARQFDRSVRVTRSASPPRQDWANVKEEDVKEEELTPAEQHLINLVTVTEEKKEEVDPTETTAPKKVRFAVINTENDGLYESINELVLFDHITTAYRVDLGYHIAMRYDGDRCNIGQLMKDHSKDRLLARINTTIKKVDNKTRVISNIIRSIRSTEYDCTSSRMIRTPLHMDLQPVDGSNKFSEQVAEEYLLSCALQLCRFTSSWAGISYPTKGQSSTLHEHESNVYGVMLLTDSLLECLEPSYLLNGALFTLIPPITLDDMLSVLNKARYDQLLIREIVVSFGHDILTYTDKVTDKTIEAAVRATFEAIDRIEALFIRRRDDFLKLDPKFGMILEISSEVTKVKENPLPNFKVLTIPEYGDRAKWFAKYNIAVRKIAPFMKNCKLVEWADYRPECDREFMQQEDQGYDMHLIHVEKRFRHLAWILYHECFLLHFRNDEERFPRHRNSMKIDSMV